MSTLEEKIANAKSQKAKIEQKIARLKSEQSKRERNARTKRLIQIGAEVEHYAGCEITDLDAFKEFLEQYGFIIAQTQIEL
jgi:hypothetical protein